MLYHTRLGEYDRAAWPHDLYFDDPVVVDELLPAFQRELEQLEAAIDADNATRRAPYLHLKPSRIPRSINV